jgi:hypothetical protein
MRRGRFALIARLSDVIDTYRGVVSPAGSASCVLTVRLLGTRRIGVDACVCISTARDAPRRTRGYAQKQREGIILMSHDLTFHDVRMSRALPFVKG